MHCEPLEKHQDNIGRAQAIWEEPGAKQMAVGCFKRLLALITSYSKYKDLHFLQVKTFLEKGDAT
jgi:hypothetical protein